MPTNEEPRDVATAETETVETDNLQEPIEEAGEKPEPTEEGTEEAKDPAKQALLADLHKARSEKRELKEKLEEAEKQLGASSEKAQAFESLQTRYDRLEQFILSAGGDVARALDSRTFSSRLFESEEPLEDILKDWRKANPPHASTALGAKASESGAKLNFNDVIRVASGR